MEGQPVQMEEQPVQVEEQPVQTEEQPVQTEDKNSVQETIPEKKFKLLLQYIGIHRELFPESEQEYDQYFENFENESIPVSVLYDLVLKYENRRLESPSIRCLNKGTKLYHASVTKFEGCPLNQTNFFARSLQEIGIFVQFLKEKRHPDAKIIYVYEYETICDINLVDLSDIYTYYTFETYLNSFIENYHRFLDIVGCGDNEGFALWLSENVGLYPTLQSIQGWNFKDSFMNMTEVMLFGDTNPYLNLTQVYFVV
jgi:hypothetical protein